MFVPSEITEGAGMVITSGMRLVRVEEVLTGVEATARCPDGDLKTGGTLMSAAAG